LTDACSHQTSTGGNALMGDGQRGRHMAALLTGPERGFTSEWTSRWAECDRRLLVRRPGSPLNGRPSAWAGADDCGTIALSLLGACRILRVGGQGPRLSQIVRAGRTPQESLTACAAVTAASDWVRCAIQP